MNRMPLEEYRSRDSLKDDLGSLCDPKLDFIRDREVVNRLVLNCVVKYLADYLKIEEAEAGWIRDRIVAVMERKARALFEMHPQEGMEYDACYGYHRPGNDEYPIRCASDIRRTAAIFKEIAFGGRFRADGQFVGLELGSGTGILMLAMAVASRRRKVEDLFVVGIERSGMAARRSQDVLGSLVGPDRVSVLCKDILEKGNLSKLFGNSIQCWVSETISLNTPKMDLDREDFGLSDDERLVRRLETGVDPYVEALRISMDELPRFRQKVEEGKTAMFPNIFNGNYAPNSGGSTLRLETSLRSDPVILERTSEEFEAYEDLGLPDKRWESPEEVNRMCKGRVKSKPVSKGSGLGYK